MSPNRTQQTKFPKGHLYHFTFNEVQTHLGNLVKPLNNVSMEELLKILISAENGHFVQNASASSSSSYASPASLILGNFNLNGFLGKKTVEEIWNEILRIQHPTSAAGNGSSQLQQSMTLGETTLAEFLLRASGISAENQDVSTANASQTFVTMAPTAALQQQPSDWFRIPVDAAAQHQQQPAAAARVLDSNFRVLETSFKAPAVEGGYSENKMAISTTVPAVAVSSSNSSAGVGVERKRWHSDEMMEKTIERRRKRMIKNRESAARSRARKQVVPNLPFWFVSICNHRFYLLQLQNNAMCFLSVTIMKIQNTIVIT